MLAPIRSTSNSQTSSAQTRQAILGSALELFASQGYQATTTAAIARAAGVNEVTLFRQFGTKAGLFATVIDSQLPVFEQIVDSIPELTDDPRRDLLEMGLFLHRQFSGRTRLMKIILREQESQPDLVRKVAGLPYEGLKNLGHYFEAFIDYHRLRPIDPGLVALTFFSFFFRSIFMSAFLGSDPVWRMNRTSIGSFVDLLLLGLDDPQMAKEAVA